MYTEDPIHVAILAKSLDRWVLYGTEIAQGAALALLVILSLTGSEIEP